MALDNIGKACIAMSIDADFEKNTWTFNPIIGFKVSAGDYAIIKESAYNELILQREVLLQALRVSTKMLDSASRWNILEDTQQQLTDRVLKNTIEIDKCDLTNTKE